MLRSLTSSSFVGGHTARDRSVKNTSTSVRVTPGDHRVDRDRRIVQGGGHREHPNGGQKREHAAGHAPPVRQPLGETPQRLLIHLPEPSDSQPQRPRHERSAKVWGRARTPSRGRRARSWPSTSGERGGLGGVGRRGRVARGAPDYAVGVMMGTRSLLRASSVRYPLKARYAARIGAMHTPAIAIPTSGSDARSHSTPDDASLDPHGIPKLQHDLPRPRVTTDPPQEIRHEPDPPFVSGDCRRRKLKGQ